MRFTFSFFAALSLFVLPLASMAQDSSAKMLMTLANQERAKLGIAPLQWDDHLAAAALDHAKLMGDQKAISHQFANEPELTKRGADHNVHFSKIAENVAMVPDVNSAHEAWMNSPHHRDNILDPEVDTVGISFVEQDGEFYVVEDFCKTVASLSLEQQEQKVADLLGSSSLKLLKTNLRARYRMGRYSKTLVCHAVGERRCSFTSSGCTGRANCYWKICRSSSRCMPNFKRK
jgi:hypothetical protein